MVTWASPRRAMADEASDGLFLIVGLAAIVFSALYFLSDVIEPRARMHLWPNSSEGDTATGAYGY